jgi:hypothetical protein
VEEKEREEKGRGGGEGGSRRGEHRANARGSPAIVVHPCYAHTIIVCPSKVSRHVNVTSGNDLLVMTSGRI